jgi:glycosyltransferase involved in cell wall biosynthesis
VKVELVMDRDIELLIPDNDVADPEVSIVVPALNEEITIKQFVEWCHQGLATANVVGEIIIVDSSQDNTARIALENGARVLKTPKRGLGRAYIDAIPCIRGKYLIFGDCDCSYDFREIAPFIREFHSGAEYVMGSRFKGFIEPGAMPPLHRYFGTPFTTWLLNFVYGSSFSDIHCGMRGITLEAFKKIKMSSQGWEYASEMVLKSVHFNLKTAEVPIRFYRDHEGRLSHHKRSGWWSPWHAGWINLRAMFIYGPFFFLFKPGIVLCSLGMLLTLPLMAGPVTLGNITFSLNWMLFGVVLTILGLQSIYMGVLSQVILDFRNIYARKWGRVFDYDKSAVTSICLLMLGCLLNVPLVRQYFTYNMRLSSVIGYENSLSIFGLMLVIISFMTFTFTLVLHATILMKDNRCD